MRVMGIDPGTRVAGWGVVDREGSRIKWVAHGVARADEKRPFAERLLQIHTGLSEAIREHSPEWVAIEEVFYGRNVKSAIKIGEGRGVGLLAAAQSGVQVAEYAPTVVKKAVVGNGAAHKTQVQEMVKVILGLAEPPSPADAADALALAICHCHRQKDGPQGGGIEEFLKRGW